MSSAYPLEIKLAGLRQRPELPGAEKLQGVRAAKDRLVTPPINTQCPWERMGSGDSPFVLEAIENDTPYGMPYLEVDSSFARNLTVSGSLTVRPVRDSLTETWWTGVTLANFVNGVWNPLQHWYTRTHVNTETHVPHRTVENPGYVWEAGKEEVAYTLNGIADNDVIVLSYTYITPRVKYFKFYATPPGGTANGQQATPYQVQLGVTDVLSATNLKDHAGFTTANTISRADNVIFLNYGSSLSTTTAQLTITGTGTLTSYSGTNKRTGTYVYATGSVIHASNTTNILALIETSDHILLAEPQKLSGVLDDGVYVFDYSFLNIRIPDGYDNKTVVLTVKSYSTNPGGYPWRDFEFWEVGETIPIYAHAEQGYACTDPFSNEFTKEEPELHPDEEYDDLTVTIGETGPFPDAEGNPWLIDQDTLPSSSPVFPVDPNNGDHRLYFWATTEETLTWNDTGDISPSVGLNIDAVISDSVPDVVLDWPWPQIIQLERHVIVASEDSVDLADKDGVLTRILVSPEDYDSGGFWSWAEFENAWYASNGSGLLTRLWDHNNERYVLTFNSGSHIKACCLHNRTRLLILFMVGTRAKLGWSSSGGDDAVELAGTVVSLTDLMTDTPAAVRKESGFTDMEWDGDGVALLPLGGSVIAYGEQGISAFTLDVGEIRSYYPAEIKGLPRGLGISGRLHALNVENVSHVFLGSDGNLWAISADLKAECLWYAEYLQNIDCISWYAEDREVWLSGASGTYVLSNDGRLTGPIKNQSNGFMRTTNGVCVSAEPPTGTGKINLISDTEDMGERAVKTVHTVQVKARDISNISVILKDQEDTTLGKPARANEFGAAFPIGAAVDIKVQITGAYDVDVLGTVEFVELQYQGNDKRMRRGPSRLAGADPMGGNA